MPIEHSDIEIHLAAQDALRDDLRVALPCTVTAVHADSGTVDCQPAILNPLTDEDGRLSYETLPGLPGVPLACLRGGGFFLYLPVTVGDSVLVIFTDLSTDSWRAAQAGPQPVRPIVVGKHTAAGCYAIPCIAPDGAWLEQPRSSSGVVTIGKDNSDQQITISGTDIELGRGATDFVALASKVDTELGKIATAFSTFVPGSGGASFPHPYVSPTSVTATLVKAK